MSFTYAMMTQMARFKQTSIVHFGGKRNGYWGDSQAGRATFVLPAKTRQNHAISRWSDQSHQKAHRNENRKISGYNPRFYLSHVKNLTSLACFPKSSQQTN